MKHQTWGQDCIHKSEIVHVTEENYIINHEKVCPSLYFCSSWRVSNLAHCFLKIFIVALQLALCILWDLSWKWEIIIQIKMILWSIDFLHFISYSFSFLKNIKVYFFITILLLYYVLNKCKRVWLDHFFN